MHDEALGPPPPEEPLEQRPSPAAWWIAGSLGALCVGLAMARGLGEWRALQHEFFRRVETLAVEASRDSVDDAVDDSDRVGDPAEGTDSVERHALDEELQRLRHKLEREVDAERKARGQLERGGLLPEEADALTEEERRARAAREALEEMVRGAEERLVRFDAELAATPVEERREARVEAERRAEVDHGFWNRLNALSSLSTLVDPRYGVVELRSDWDLPTPYGSAPRIDRCATCHLAMVRDEKPVEAATEGLLAPHPRPELYVAPGSAHPASRFGCTVCHGGDGRGTSMARAGHDPSSASPILDGSLAQASCDGCHETLPRTDPSSPGILAEPVANAREMGEDLLDALACATCHGGSVEAARAARRAPPLSGLEGLDPDWAARWIASPRTLHPAARMPELFGDTSAEQRDAEAVAIVHYLRTRAAETARDPVRETDGPPRGDPEVGAELYGRLGCGTCHLLALDSARERILPHPERLLGPPLGRAGERLRPSWTAAFLRNPQALRSGTTMPSFRLSGGEADDLAAFLHTRRGEAPVAPAPPLGAALRDRLARAALEASFPLEDAAARLARMRDEEKVLVIGEHALQRRGCVLCHEIAGLEIRPTDLAAPLAEVAARTMGDSAKILHFASWLDETAHGGAAPSPGPRYALGADESRVLLTALAARANPTSLPPRPARAEAETVRDMRRLVRRLGCRGCHALGGRQSALTADLEFEAPRPRPPSLDFEGARARPDWLVEYLRDPGARRLRPGMEIRMPTFDLTAAERRLLVEGMALRDAQPFFVETPSPTPADLVVGEAVAVILQCLRCHVDDPEARDLPSDVLAPGYGGVAERLRPEWVVEWILDPRRFDPDTPMPVGFPRGDDGAPSSEFLAEALAIPMFRDQRERLERHFDDPAELDAYLDDPRRVATALRDYLWSLGARR